MTLRKRGIAAASLSLLTATLAVPVVATTASAAEPEVVSQVDFAAGFGDWQPNGDSTATIVDGDDPYLAITERVNDYDGLRSATGLFDVGATYEVSMNVRLAADAPQDTAEVRAVGVPGYTWIGNTSMNKDTWTEVSGSWTATAGDELPFLYVGTADLGEAYGYDIDDIVVTRTAEPSTCEPETLPVSSQDFEAAEPGEWGGDGQWGANGDASPTVVAEEDGQALLIDGRGNDYDGIRTVGGVLDAGTEYTVSARLRLGDDAPAEAAGMRLVGVDGYTWIASQTVTKDGWTDISGTWIADGEDADGAVIEPYIYVGTEDLGATYSYLIDDLTITTVSVCDDDGLEPGTVLIDEGFEDGLNGWFARNIDPDEAADPPNSPPTVAVTGDYAHTGAQSAGVTSRDHQGDGIALDVTDVLVPRATVDLTAWVRMGEGQTAGDVWLTLQRTLDGANSYDTIGQFTGITNSGWTQVTASFTPAAFDEAVLYFETAYDAGNPGNTSDFYIDDVLIEVPEPAVIEDLTPLQNTVPFPLGVAIDSRETAGSAAQLLQRHFTQVTAENHMKPESWYTADGEFSPHPDAIAIMDDAVANDLRVYGHVLVWHSQTPAWFFTRDDATPLTDSAADQALLSERMRTHIFAIAEWMASEYGQFGSSTNPLVAWDVVNEVISDSGEYEDGMRRSRWYDVLGEEFVDLAFQYANEAFNGTYAAEGVDHPVELFINDYNTEQSGKRGRYAALIDRLIERDAPIDGVGHQFHVNLAFPVGNLAETLEEFVDTGLIQAVTELDVTTGTPESEAKFIDQGYYYQEAFATFRDYAEELYSVTVWGLIDSRSWRDANGGPLLFDDGFQAKPAYYGAAGADLPAPLRTANAFAGEVDLDPSSAVWDRLPLLPAGPAGGFQTRWDAQGLTVHIEVADKDGDDGDGVTVRLGDESVTVGRDGSGGADAVVTDTAEGYAVDLRVPASGLAEGDTVQLDVAVTADGATEGWNAPGVLGTVTLVEELSFASVPFAGSVPTIDGNIDDAWSAGVTVTTDTQVEGSETAVGTFRLMWRDTTLYVLGEVADDDVDATGSDPWTQDSVEIYVDAGNVKNGSYRYDDTQIRISADGLVSYGTGDETFQANRVESAVTRTDAGYIVEAAISLLEYGGGGTFHGVDVQVNDASDGTRQGIRNWADPTGAGYQSTARWGVVRLAEYEPICAVSYDVHGTWPGGFIAQVWLENTSDSAISPWELQWHYTGDERVTQSWSATVDQDGPAVTMSAMPWNAALEPGGRVTFGFLGASQGEPGAPTGFALPDGGCEVLD